MEDPGRGGRQDRGVLIPEHPTEGDAQAHPAHPHSAAGSPPSPVLVGVGTDVASVAQLRDSVRRFGDRYLQRLFTAGEIAECGTGPGRITRLAELFAAKESVYKALAPPRTIGFGWNQIDVRRSSRRLFGELAAWSHGRRLQIHTSTASQGDVAVAFAVVEERE